MTNEEKAREIAINNRQNYFEGDIGWGANTQSSECECYDSAIEMAEWKDEQYKEREEGLREIQKGQLIDKACEWLKSRISVDAPIETNENGEPLAGSWLDVQMERVKLTEEFIANFKQAMEGGAE